MGTRILRDCVRGHQFHATLASALREFSMERLPFKLQSDYAPAGDQPAGDRETLRRADQRSGASDAAGSHGMRQDIHSRRQVIDTRAAPDAGAGAQQDPRRAAVRGISRVLSEQCGGVLCFLLRLLPARSLCALHGHLYREGLLDQRAHRADAPVGHQGAAGALRLPSSSPRSPRSTAWATRRPTCPWCCTSCAAIAWISAGCCGAWRTCSTRATSWT